jgi:H+-translocating NAD(P) transhydrogenase subunit alpha
VREASCRERRQPPAEPGSARREQEAARDVSELPLVIELTILVLAAFLGFEVISKVPTMLHTPLMSGANFIHGIVIVGAILVLGTADDGFTKVAGFLALVLATANVVGGWFVTDRMLGMFKRRPEPKREESGE